MARQQVRRKRNNNYRKRLIMPSSPLEHRKSRSFKSFFIKIFSLALLTSLYWFFISDAMMIKKINIKGVEGEAKIKIESQVGNFISSGILSRNFYFLSTNNLEEILQDGMPEFKEITVTKIAGSKEVFIEGLLRDVKFNWITGGETYIVDKEGIVVASGAQDLVLNINDKTNTSISVGDRVGSPDLMLFIDNLGSSFSSTGLEAKEIIIKNEFKRDIEVKTTDIFSVYFDSTRNLENQLSGLTRIMVETKRDNKKISEYIDLRIENKIFMK
ncbi:MAG: hypothetical protein UT66_C0020G0019 [candidate division CPR2 bacterium GW2011_GWC1_39_9]|uniref:POTRA domain-containing protein n=1 Tax=candidate division CPR2 bacterium GW2011_GWC2_39_10 TaxID=1618345 RepID=A0A0G0PZH8_UNCC2|nr:MAG: hypothetical protein UT18_C0007G0082 [candidate division CPR2 bacterium GW2011_GWC2_39_10]KKR34586.1 MAG: hypothetical protein UT66_C0020G0019 [candidate division CPR2 bacterium GW2011_GWC1_39_9]